MFLYSTGASGNTYMQTQRHSHMAQKYKYLPNSFASTLFLGLHTFMENNAKGGRNMIFEY